MKLNNQILAAFAFGGLCTFIAMLAIGADSADVQGSPRYIISSWARPHDSSDDNGWNKDHGAYRVDTVTGQILEIVGNRCGDVK